MGERKVLNKYYPPDFDPAKIPKRKQLKNLQMKVRMMLPMSIRCNTCGQYMYKGTKFNCRKEDVQGETYLGLLKFRFYFKCTKCSAELIMKTDPQNSDYEMEAGASRNFEPWREADEVKAAAKKQREEEEMGDAMKALENRTLDSKIEMDILAGLDEVKSLRARQAQIDQGALLEALKRSAAHEQEAVQKSEQEMDEEDERLIQAIFRNPDAGVRRLQDDEEEDEEQNGVEPGPSFPRSTLGVPAAAARQGKGSARGGLEKRPMAAYGSDDEDHSSPKRLKPILRAVADADGERATPGSEDNSQGSSHVPAKGAAQSSGGSRVPGESNMQESRQPPSATTLLVKAEDAKPIFEVKPVKVQFAVKEKGRPGLQKTGEGKANGALAKVLPAAKGAASTKQMEATQGLSLLMTSYDDSDEGSE